MPAAWSRSAASMASIRTQLATDLAKLSLWLATLARDHEFTFLDHALKSGDSLVGLTQAQIARRIGTRRSPACRCSGGW